jgi:aminoglycoside phosphotransferase (APT) family kinase protein
MMSRTENRLTLAAPAAGMASVTVPRMHDDEVDVDDALVGRLLAAQLPELAHLPLTRIVAWGTDHAIFRLGDELSVRLPKIGWAAKQGEKESRWLCDLAPHLPIEVPVPLAVGAPADGYPFPWYVSPWLGGENPASGSSVDARQLAVDLAAFVLALQRIDTTGAPPPKRAQRGGPLAPADEYTRQQAAQLRDEVDVAALLSVWDAGVNAPGWEGPPVWVHGDLSDGNLLVRAGRLSGVIDWGGLSAGDPAVELMVAWSFFDAERRAVYRDALGFVNDSMWLRGRAWATSAAIQALPYYRDTNPDIVARSWRTVREVLADLERG